MIVVAMFLSLLVWVSEASATVVNAASCSVTDISTAVTAAVDGDTVQIPGGSCTYASSLLITNKSITIKGAGPGTSSQCAVPGQTTYTCLTVPGKGIQWTAKATGGFPAGQTFWEGITLTLLANQSVCNTYAWAALTFLGETPSLRITNSRFVTTDNSCGVVVFQGYIRGVIFGNTFTSNNVLSHTLVVTHSTWGNVGGNGDNSWATPDSMGTNDAIFIEDNTFEPGPSTVGLYNTYTDHMKGARVVERFNRYTDGSIHNHGLDSSGRLRPPRHREVYRNFFTWTGTADNPMIVTRGLGTARIFDNSRSSPNVAGSGGKVVDTNYYRGGPTQGIPSQWPFSFCGDTPVTITRTTTTATATCTSRNCGVNVGGSPGYITITGAGAPFNVTGVLGTGIDNTHFTYTVVDSGPTSASGTLKSPYDGNQDSTGYPCMDQPGRGKGDYLSGDGPGGTTMTPVAWLNQIKQPYYLWNNTDDGALSPFSVQSGSDVIHSLRDYYEQNAAFDGSTNHGVGRGRRIDRPSTCDPGDLTTDQDGDAYWSFDGGGNWNTSTIETISAQIDTVNYIAGADGGIDKCVAANTWQNDWYVPVPYPHYLRAGSASKFKGASGNHKISGKVTMQ